MFNTDPSVRPNINELMFHLENICQTRSIHLVENLTFLKKTELLLHQNNQATAGATATSAPTSASTTMPINVGASISTANNWMGSALKGGNSFFKTIKEASTKVIDTVQSSINRTDLDLVYLTPRLCVMSCPTDGIESAAFGNNIEAIREALHAKHGKNYRIYNLANKTFRKGKNIFQRFVVRK
jgi:cyclin G-associated kinase